MAGSSPIQWHEDTFSAWGQASSRRAWLVAVLAGGVGLVLTALIALVLTGDLREREIVELDGLAESAGVAVDRRVAAYSGVLFGLLGLFGTDLDTSRSDFSRYVRMGSFQERYPGIQAPEFTRLVLDREIASFETSVRSDLSFNGIGYPDFAMHPVDPDHTDHFIVDYIEPFLGNEQAFGFDLGSSAERRVAVEAAEIPVSP